MSNHNSSTITTNENDKDNDENKSSNNSTSSSPSPPQLATSSSSAVTKTPTPQTYFFNNSNNSMRLVSLVDNYSTDNSNKLDDGDNNNRNCIITNCEVNSSSIESTGGGGGGGVVGNGEINVNNPTNGHDHNSQQRIASPSSTDGVDNPEQITPFSLKHFLKRDNSVGTSGNNSGIGNSTASITKMTGARPKVPLNIGNSSSSISGTSGGGSAGGLSSTSNSAESIKMKRSPRFSSFDSQASLAEFSYASSSTSLPIDSITNDGEHHYRHRTQYNYRNNCSNSSSNSAGNRSVGYNSRSGNGIASGDGGCGGDGSDNTNMNGGTNDYLYLKDDKSGFQRSFSTFDISGRRYPTISHTTPNLQRIQDDDLDIMCSTTTTSTITPVSTSSSQIAATGTQNSLPDAIICPLLNNDDMMVSAEFSSALPDFVKDHIVVENYYKNAISKSSSTSLNQHHQQDIQLPDFTLNETNNIGGGGDHNIPFDLMCNSVEPSGGGGGGGRQSACSDGNRLDPPRNSPLMILPLDLPNVSSTSGDSYDRESIRHDSDIAMNDNIPLDLTDQAYPHQFSSLSSSSPYRISTNRYSIGGGGGGGADSLNRHIADSSSGNNNGAIGGLPQLSSVDSTFQTLPDFLSDGHIHQSSSTAAAGIRHHHHHHHHDVQPIPSPSSTSSLSNNQTTTNRSLNSLSLENIRLREELIHSHIIMTQQTVRISELESNLDLSNYHQRNCNNLSQTQQRIYKTNNFYNNENGGSDSSASATTNQINLDKDKVINNLQEQIKQLTEQVEVLRQENAILKEDGAIGGGGGGDTIGATSSCHPSMTIPTASTIPQRVIIQSQELSRDMMLAAVTAENNLRQLLSGVENLRLMARRIDNIVDSGSNNGGGGGVGSVNVGGDNISSPPSSSAPMSPSSRLAHEMFSSDGEYDDFNCPRRNL